MSDAGALRIRARASAGDESVMGFVLDADIAPGQSARFDAPRDSPEDAPEDVSGDKSEDAPLVRALFAVPGVVRAEVSGATIWVKKAPAADWAALKPAVAAAIRSGLDGSAAPLGRDDTSGATANGGADGTDPDAALLAAVRDLLDRQVNPAVAGHGGHIAADRVAGGTVYLRMSGGCQGCAASAATLRQGVERMLRAALPRIVEIVDVTDHTAGDNPFYARDDSPSPVLNRAIPADVIGWEDGQIIVDPDFLAPRLGLTPETLREGLRSGDVVGVTETGAGADAGKTRIVLRSAHRSWAAEIDAAGAAREIPPPRRIEAGAGKDTDLSNRVRAHLQELTADQAPITYGALARALGLWMPGAVGRVTQALETTMREDAATGRPFVAARTVSRGRGSLPGKGFFDLARALSRGPRDGESDQQFHERELGQLDRALAQQTGPGTTKHAS